MLKEHDPEKWVPVFGKIMLEEHANAKCRVNLKSFRYGGAAYL